MLRALLTCFLTVLVGGVAFSQADPPARVAQLSYVEGQVSLQPAGVEEWVPAAVNRPMTTGEGIWADDGSRAEFRIGNATVRLSKRTGVSILSLDDRTAQIRLDQGDLKINLRQLDEGEIFEVDTPNIAFSLKRPGEYRLEVNEPGDVTRITVRAGEGEAYSGGQAVPLGAPRTMRVVGAESVSYSFSDPGPPDDFEEWCSLRERRGERSESAKYVSREMVGYQDLDDYGSWRADSGYGAVWSPRGVAADWAPYRDGRWVWIDPWGWTWIDHATWGFAPFHYGRWVFLSGRWSWAPGPMVARPVYAPALVVFVGGGSFGGRVAWFPLGPREPYVPAYRVSAAYLSRVNVTTVNVTRIDVARISYVNRGHVTLVSRETFVTSRPVRGSVLRVDTAAMARARVTNVVAVAPRRASVVGHGTLPATVARPPAHVMNRVVVARATPPPARAPFSRQERLLTKNHGRPLDSSEVAWLQPKAAPQPRVRSAMASSSRQSGPPPGRLPESRSQRPAANSRDARTEERRLKQEQQQRERQAGFDQKRRQEQQRQTRQQQDKERQQQQQRTQPSSERRRTYPPRQQQPQPGQPQRTSSEQQPKPQPDQQQGAQPSQRQRKSAERRKQTTQEKKSPPPEEKK